jgi:4'-phosphopantetheinyl transferase
MKIVEWRYAPVLRELEPGEVHVWRVNLDVDPVCLVDLRQVLTEDERQRSDRFRFEVDRQRFIVARATLRHLLATYLETTPEQVQFCYGNRGKPAIAYPSTDLAFNISHSQNRMLCALTYHHRVGIDLEFLREMKDLESLATRFFQPSECKAMITLAKGQRTAAFFHLWTCKEAILKAIGTGLIGLENVELCLKENCVELIRLEGDRRAASDWFLYSFTAESGYASALTTDQVNPVISFFQW